MTTTGFKIQRHSQYFRCGSGSARIYNFWGAKPERWRGEDRGAEGSGYIVYRWIQRSARIKQLQEFLKSDHHWLWRYCILSRGVFYFEPPCIHHWLIRVNGDRHAKCVFILVQNQVNCYLLLSVYKKSDYLLCLVTIVQSQSHTILSSTMSHHQPLSIHLVTDKMITTTTGNWSQSARRLALSMENLDF